MLAQPDDVTCGPTCLHAVYRYFGETVGLDEVIRGVNYLEDGGTLAVYLGIDALRRGYDASLYSFNLHVFDPSWAGLPASGLIGKLRQQLLYKGGRRFEEATEAYVRYLEEGGTLCFDDLTPTLLATYLKQETPVLAGLSATYLYDSMREYTGAHNRAVYDDLRGMPVGHFVVICGMTGSRAVVADPYSENPISGNHYYEVDVQRLLRAILLGIVTYDANLLILTPTAAS